MRETLRILAGALGALGSLARPAGAATRVACVGDSITAGSGLPAGQAYPEVLAGYLGPDWLVGNFGLSGSTAMKTAAIGPSYWSTLHFLASQHFEAEVVVIMLGTNDTKALNWRGGVNQYESDYRALVATYLGLPGPPRVYVALPPPTLKVSYFIEGAVIERDIVPLVERVAAEMGVGLIDVHGAFAPETARYFGKGEGGDIGDGVHPNQAGARRIAETVARTLLGCPADVPLPVPPAPAGCQYHPRSRGAGLLPALIALVLARLRSRSSRACGRR